MVWGGITYGKNTELGFFFLRTSVLMVERRKNNSRGLCETNLRWPLAQFLNPENGLILMEDGASIHRINAPRDWCKNVVLRSWSGQPNRLILASLNPIENIWKQMKDKVQRGYQPEMTNLEFKLLLKNAWDSFEPCQ
jgi:hypothetical protein